MNALTPILVEILLSWTRAALIAGGTYLVTHHVLTAGQSDALTGELLKHAAIVSPILIGLIWSVLKVRSARIKFLTALAAPPGTSEESVKAKIANGLGATITGVLLIAFMIQATPAAAQALPIDAFARQLPTAGERTAADVASWVTVIADVALDTKASWDAPNRLRAFELQGARVGVTYAAVFAAKLAVHRLRPCAPDCGTDNPDYSFFSGHTALGFSTIGGPRLAFSLPLAIGTGGLRIAAGKHYFTDVAFAAAVGAAAGHWIR